MTNIDFQHSQALQAPSLLLKSSTKLAFAFIFLVLSACSGQDAATSASTSSASTSSKTTAQQTSKELAQNPAVLTLTAPAPNATQSGQIQAQSGIQPQALPQLSTANFSPVTRIQNTTLPGSYFFTIFNTERITALVGNPGWKEEGPAFWASTVADTGLSPVHRFRNKFNGSYLYTINDGEKNDILANYASFFTLEGTAWYASPEPTTGFSPLYRFRNLNNGTYLFTANETEKNNILANYASTFKLEGVAYYVWQSTAAPPPSSNTECGIPNFDAEVLAFVNAYRASGAVCRGVTFPAVGALAWSSQLHQSAALHSADMANNNFFAHTSATNGSTVGTRVTAAGYNYRSVGENIAAGYSSVAQVMLGWMESTTGHCENIMNATHRDIGVSCKMNPASVYKTYWTMDVGAR